MKCSTRWMVLTSAMVAAGCASESQLMFTDTTSFGVRLGTDTANAGASVTVGYKATSLAVVPVSVLDAAGSAKAVRGTNGNADADAMSVFAIFKAKGKESTSSAGQMFSTGVAAQLLTEGYSCPVSKSAKGCKPEAPEAAALAASQAAGSALQAANAASAAEHFASLAKGATSAPPAKDAPTGDRPAQPPLLFGRSDVGGIDIGTGALATQGLSFTLGYANVNVALVPTYALSSGNRPTSLYGSNNGKSGPRDAYSVLGQFDVRTDVKKFDFGLERYFATGNAAQNLAEGMRQAVAAERAASASD